MPILVSVQDISSGYGAGKSRLMKIVFLFLLTVCTLPVCAQVSIGVTGGYNHSFFRTFYVPAPSIGDDPTVSTKRKFAPKWRAGFLADIHLLKRFHLQPQLVISKKGDKIKYETDFNGYEIKTLNTISLAYLELPLNLLYKIPLRNGKLAVGGGPYFAKALSGRYREITTTTDRTTSSETRKQGSIQFKNEEDLNVASNERAYYYKEQDAGLNFTAGYECRSGLLFNINYSLGLTKLYTFSFDQFRNDSRKNSYFGLSAAYLFKL